jgi:hypothetical protein
MLGYERWWISAVTFPVAVACTSDDFAPSPGVNDLTDAGDASSDASTTDAGSDASDGDSSPPLATWSVLVEANGMPEGGAGLAVLSSLPDGGIYELGETDANGQVSMNVPDGGSISVFAKVNDSSTGTLKTRRDVFSYFGVKAEHPFRLPNAELPAPDNAPIGDITFIPDGSFPGGTAVVDVRIPCEGNQVNSGNPYAVLVFPQLSVCNDATEYYAVLRALDATGKVVSAAFIENIPASPGNSSYIASFQTPVSFGDYQTQLSPLPTDAITAAVTVKTGLASGTYSPSYAKVSYSGLLGTPLGAGLVTVAVVTAFPEYEVHDVMGFASTAEGLQRTNHRYRTVSTLENGTWDATELGRLATLSPYDLAIIERPSLSWTFESAANLGHCVNANAKWFKDGSLDDLTAWSATRAVGATGSVQLPELPDTLAEYAPGTGDALVPPTITNYTLASAECHDLSLPPELLNMASPPDP